LELNEKVSDLSEGMGVRPREKAEIRHKENFDDALSALINLGYPSRSAKKAIEYALRRETEINLETLLKEALRNLATGNCPQEKDEKDQ
ncbi:MAG: hypothetical protein ACETVU_04250, partial [Desulfatiglandales bacterium]